MALERESEVKLDFGNAAQLAAHLRSAAASLSSMRRDLGHILRESGQTARNMGMAPGGSTSAANLAPQARQANHQQLADRAALFGTAAAASAYTFRSMSLANPAAVQRFHDAIDDTAAVLGHRLIPALEWFTRQIRGVGDFFANHQTAATATAYGIGGLGLLATGAGLYGVGKMAFRGGVGAYNDMRGLMGSGRMVQAAETAAQASQVSAAVDTAQLAATTRFGRMGKFGRFASKAAVPIGVAYTAYEGYEAYQDDRSGANMAQNIGRTMPLADAAHPGGTTGSYLTQASHYLTRKLVGASKEEYDERMGGLYATNAWWNVFYDPDKARAIGAQPWEGYKGPPDSSSSWGAAAKPAHYEDVLGSVMSMRQSIASGAGGDPAARSAEANEKSASILSQIWDAVTAAGTFGLFPSSERSTKRES